MKNIGRVLNIGMEFVAAVAGLYVMISGGQEYVIGIKNRDYRKMISGALTFALRACGTSAAGREPGCSRLLQPAVRAAAGGIPCGHPSGGGGHSGPVRRH